MKTKINKIMVLIVMKIVIMIVRIIMIVMVEVVVEVDTILLLHIMISIDAKKCVLFRSCPFS